MVFMMEKSNKGTVLQYEMRFLDMGSLSCERELRRASKKNVPEKVLRHSWEIPKISNIKNVISPQKNIKRFFKSGKYDFFRLNLIGL